jgi:uncharacterized DUF497 family protein
MPYFDALKIEFDPAKSARNIRERGLPFELAAAAVLAENVIGKFIDDRRDYGERAAGRVWSGGSRRLLCVVETKRDVDGPGDLAAQGEFKGGQAVARKRQVMMVTTLDDDQNR